MKVFCAKCRFFRMPGGRYLCQKAEKIHTDTWLERDSQRELPATKNAGNDCPDYKSKREG